MHSARWMSQNSTSEFAADGDQRIGDSADVSAPSLKRSETPATEPVALVIPKRTSIYPFPLHDRNLREREPGPIPTPKLPPLPPGEAENNQHTVLSERQIDDRAQLLAKQGRVQHVEQAAPTGKNSYLQVDLSERPFLQALHEMTQTIPSKLDEALQAHVSKGNEPKLQQLPIVHVSKQLKKSRMWKSKRWIRDIISPKTGKTEGSVDLPPLHIVPRPLSKLHCTLFFGGYTLCALSNDDLRKWHEKVTRRLELSGFLLEGGDFPDAVKVHMPEEYWLHVSELTCFPPRGRHLIVAQLQASKCWHQLWGDLRNIALNDVPGLQKFMNFPSQRLAEQWIPHITLADIFFTVEGKRIEEKILCNVLSDWPLESFDFVENMKCTSISMGGPVPQPKSESADGSPAPVLDWTFAFQDTRRGCH